MASAARSIRRIFARSARGYPERTATALTELGHDPLNFKPCSGREACCESHSFRCCSQIGIGAAFLVIAHNPGLRTH
jgi:hypothetical protein